jgi:DMSO/TMAO reductase YedYZ molybdopterin-dependent catalytic subunit
MNQWFLETVYRLCVERWSMQILWIGFPLSKLWEKVEPNDKQGT